MASPWRLAQRAHHLVAAVIASDLAKSHARCGSAAYWVVSLSLVPLVALVSGAVAVWLVRKHGIKCAAHYNLPDGEVCSSACFHLAQSIAKEALACQLCVGSVAGFERTMQTMP